MAVFCLSQRPLQSRDRLLHLGLHLPMLGDAISIKRGIEQQEVSGGGQGKRTVGQRSVPGCELLEPLDAKPSGLVGDLVERGVLFGGSHCQGVPHLSRDRQAHRSVNYAHGPLCRPGAFAPVYRLFHCPSRVRPR